jgi:hypothetical protein
MFAGFGGGALAQARLLQHGVYMPELRVGGSAHGLPTSLAEHPLAPLQWQAAANQPLTVASVPWQLSVKPTRLDRRYQPVLGRLWRLGDSIGSVVQLVDGARALVNAGPHSTNGVGSLSLSLISILTVTITYSTCLSDAQVPVASEARRIRVPRVMGTQLGINWAEVRPGSRRGWERSERRTLLEARRRPRWAHGRASARLCQCGVVFGDAGITRAEAQAVLRRFRLPW